MVEQRYLLFIVGILLLLPVASAYTVDKVTLDWQGREVRTLAPDKTLDGVRLTLKLSADFKDCFDKYNSKTCVVVVDASSLKDASLSKLNLNVRECRNQSDRSYLCSSAPFTLKTASAANKISYYTQVNTVKSTTQSSTITLTLDTTTPKVASITTGYCKDAVCYVAANAPSPFTVTFDDAQSSFDYRLVFVDAQGGSAVRASACTGKACTGNITVPCAADGQESVLRITSMAGVTSREDAQNPVVLAQQKVICSTQAPKVLEWKLTSDGIGGQAISGGTLTAVAKVKSFVGKATGVVDTSLINGVNKTAASCAQDDADETVYTCTWQIGKLNPGKFDLSFILSDSIGNSYLAPANKPVRVTVLNLTKPTKALNYFSAQAGAPNPDQINRMALDLARTNYMPYPVYVPYTVTRLNPKANIIRQDLKACWYKLQNETNYTSQYNLFAFGGMLPESRVLYPEADYDSANRLNLQIRADRKTLQLSDKFDVKCQLDFVVTEGNTIYSTPLSTNITFTIGLRESPLGQPGKEFVDKIDDVSDQLNAGDARRIMQLEKLRQQFDQVCKGAETVAYIQSVSGSIENLGHAYCASGVAASAGKVLHSLGSKINTQAESFMLVAWEGKAPSGGIFAKIQNAQKFTSLLSSNNALVPVAGPLQMVCRQVNCRAVADTSGGLSATGQWTNDLAAYGKQQLASNLNVADPENGIVASVSMMCAGGVIYNMNKNLAIDCEYLQCLKQQSTAGSSVAVCDLERSFNKCMRVVGEAGELPYVRIMKNIMGNANHVLKNLPMIGARFAFMETCADYTGAMKKVKDIACGDMHAFSCVFVDSVLSIADTQKQSTQALSGLRNEAAQQKAKDVCAAAITDKPNNKIVQKGINSAVSSFGSIARNAAAQRDAQLSSGSASVVPTPAQQVQEQYFLRHNVLPSKRSTTSTCLGSGAQCSQVEFTERNAFGQSWTDITVTDDKGTYTISAKGELENVAQGFGITVEKRYLTNDEALSENMGTIYEDESGEKYILVKNFDNNVYQAQADGIALPSNPADQKAYAAQYVNGKLRRNKLDEQVGSSAAMKDTVTLVMNYNGCSTDSCRQGIAKELKDKKGILCEGESCTAKVGKDGKSCATGNDCAEVTKDDQVYDTSQANRAYAALANIAGSYAGKWLQDKGFYEKMQLGGAVADFADKLDPERVKLSICQDKNDIDGDDIGAIYSFSNNQIASVTATFGSERRLLENESGKNYNYITIAYVANPVENKNDFMMHIALEDLGSCLGSNCPATYSLTNNADFNLSAGMTFGNGNAPKTKIIYLPGEYKKVCIDFDQKFPDPAAATSKQKYCRMITETTFHTGSPPPPATTSMTSTDTTGTAALANPLGGWT